MPHAQPSSILEHFPCSARRRLFFQSLMHLIGGRFFPAFLPFLFLCPFSPCRDSLNTALSSSPLLLKPWMPTRVSAVFCLLSTALIAIAEGKPWKIQHQPHSHQPLVGVSPGGSDRGQKLKKPGESERNRAAARWGCAGGTQGPGWADGIGISLAQVLPSPHQWQHRCVQGPRAVSACQQHGGF